MSNEVQQDSLTYQHSCR